MVEELDWGAFRSMQDRVILFHPAKGGEAAKRDAVVVARWSNRMQTTRIEFMGGELHLACETLDSSSPKTVVRRSGQVAVDGWVVRVTIEATLRVDSYLYFCGEWIEF